MSDNQDIDQKARYRESHEWARPTAAASAGGNTAVEYECGISRHAESSLGDVVFVELPKVGASFKQGEAFGVIESVKAASDLYSPISGTVTAVNEELRNNPAIINSDPFGKGWIVKIVATESGEWDRLLNPENYARLVAQG
jgi:glycine cleavage system H protein